MKKYLLIISGLILIGQFLLIMAFQDNSNYPGYEYPGPEYSIPEYSGQMLPDLALPDLFDPNRQINSKDIKSQNIRIINFFASWCGPCKIEHPLLMALTEKKMAILGINYLDGQATAAAFLKDKGNPYKLIAWDPKGSTEESWGIVSIPQTFVINEKGEILYHKSGRLHPEDVTEEILPLLQKDITRTIN